jgi:hypothetical protein
MRGESCRAADTRVGCSSPNGIADARGAKGVVTGPVPDTAPQCRIDAHRTN